MSSIKVCSIFILSLALLGARAGHAEELTSPTPELRTQIEESSSPFAWSWNARLFGRAVSDEVEESRTTGIAFLGQGKRQFNEYLDIGVGAWVNLQTGSTHSLYETNRVQNGVLLDEAFVNLHAVPETVTVSAGALNQRYLKNPLLVDEVSFPAIQEKIKITSGALTASLVLQQAIPTSTSLSTRTVEKEPLPYFLTENLFLTYAFSKPTRFGIRLGHFSFSDLPSQVALDSLPHGNIVDASVPESSRFATGFSGYTYGADFATSVASRVDLSLGADFIRNTEADARYANGTLAFTQLEWRMNSRWALTPRAEYFRTERQVSPAYYNSADYGHNNRHGFNYELKLVSASQGLAIKGRYTDAALIETDPLQANSKIFMVYLEMFDASVK